MCGSATEAMEVSSTSMKVASMTEMAISHGLKAGRASDKPPVPATVVLAIRFSFLRVGAAGAQCGRQLRRNEGTDASSPKNDSFQLRVLLPAHKRSGPEVL